MQISAKTDVGKVRQENQDDYRAGIQQDGSVWAVVCDGMGGANGGSVASSLAVNWVEQCCTDKLFASFSAEELEKAAVEMIRQANQQVHQQALRNQALQGMGTTMVVALSNGRQTCIAWVGDSRAYLLQNDKLTQLTRDHSMVQDLVEKGMLTPRQAAEHPQKNVITRAVGIHTDVEVGTLCLEVNKQEVLLLCTDGLTNALETEEIEGILRDEPFYKEAECLIAGVLKKEEQDNATVVLLAFTE